VGCLTIVGAVVVAHIIVVLLFRLDRAVGWPVPAGVVVIAGFWIWRRRQRPHQREGR
jgi:hypothetical protein